MLSYNQNKERIGYIPRDQKEFLKAYNRYKYCITNIKDHYFNESEYPIKYCHLEIEICLCNNIEFYRKGIADYDRQKELTNQVRAIKLLLKDKNVPNIEKLTKLMLLNESILLFNKQTEKDNWVTIPIKETVILMNKLKMNTQLDFIKTHIKHTAHTATQEKYINNFLAKNK